MNMRTLFSVILMLTLSPMLAAATLVCSNPERWGGSPDPLTIFTMSVFGLFTVPLWPTYIPAIILTPVIMRRIAVHRVFRTLPLPAILGISLCIGALAGIGVLGFVIVTSWHDSSSLALNWASAGAISGAITLALIAYIYRYDLRTTSS